MNRTVTVVTMSALLVGLAAGCASPGSPGPAGASVGSASTQPPSPAASAPAPALVARLTAIMKLNAEAMGDPSPTMMAAVKTDLPTAERLADAGGSPSDYADQSVYLIYARGKFTGAGEKGPTQTPGSMMTVVVDATTLEVTALSVGDTVINLASAGPIIALG
jgi:hypothetical protein